jgi:hypothetical protein
MGKTMVMFRGKIVMGKNWQNRDFDGNKLSR